MVTKKKYPLNFCSRSNNFGLKIWIQKQQNFDFVILGLQQSCKISNVLKTPFVSSFSPFSNSFKYQKVSPKSAICSLPCSKSPGKLFEKLGLRKERLNPIPLLKLHPHVKKLNWQLYSLNGSISSPQNTQNFFFNRAFDKNRLKALITWSVFSFGENKTINLVEKLKSIGYSYATKAGISLSIDDLKIPSSKKAFLNQAEEVLDFTNHQVNKGHLTSIEYFSTVIETWNKTSESLKEEVIANFKKTDELNPVFLMAFSGARGNMSQVRQLTSMRGLMSDPQGKIINFPIQSNFREGLTLTEYIISCYGARKGVVDTALKTATSGYLTRRLVDVAQHVIIRGFNCGTQKGIYLADLKQGTKILLALKNRLLGRRLAEDIYNTKNELIATRNQEMNANLSVLIAKTKTAVLVRSPITCQEKDYVCQLCYGWSLATHRLVPSGEAVGIIAGQSIGEPGTQLTMRTFHTGGVFSGEVSDEIKAPVRGLVFFQTSIPGKLVRTMYGQMAFLTKQESFLFLNFSPEPNVSKESPESREKVGLKIPAYTLLFVKQNQLVEKNQILGEAFAFLAGQNQSVEAYQTLYSDLSGEIRFQRTKGIRKKKNYLSSAETVGLKANVRKGSKGKNIFNSSASTSMGEFWILSAQKQTVSEPTNLIVKPGDFLHENATIYLSKTYPVVIPSSNLLKKAASLANNINQTKQAALLTSSDHAVGFKTSTGDGKGSLFFYDFGHFGALKALNENTFCNLTSLNTKKIFKKGNAFLRPTTFSQKKPCLVNLFRLKKPEFKNHSFSALLQNSNLIKQSGFVTTSTKPFLVTNFQKFSFLNSNFLFTQVLSNKSLSLKSHFRKHGLILKNKLKPISFLPETNTLQNRTPYGGSRSGASEIASLQKKRANAIFNSKLTTFESLKLHQLGFSPLFKTPTGGFISMPGDCPTTFQSKFKISSIFLLSQINLEKKGFSEFFEQNQPRFPVETLNYEFFEPGTAFSLEQVRAWQFFAIATIIKLRANFLKKKGYPLVKFAGNQTFPFTEKAKKKLKNQKVSSKFNQANITTNRFSNPTPDFLVLKEKQLKNFLIFAFPDLLAIMESCSLKRKCKKPIFWLKQKNFFFSKGDAKVCHFSFQNKKTYTYLKKRSFKTVPKTNNLLTVYFFSTNGFIGLKKRDFLKQPFRRKYIGKPLKKIFPSPISSNSMARPYTVGGSKAMIGFAFPRRGKVRTRGAKRIIALRPPTVQDPLLINQVLAPSLLRGHLAKINGNGIFLCTDRASNPLREISLAPNPILQIDTSPSMEKLFFTEDKGYGEIPESRGHLGYHSLSFSTSLLLNAGKLMTLHQQFVLKPLVNAKDVKTSWPLLPTVQDRSIPENGILSFSQKGHLLPAKKETFLKTTLQGSNNKLFRRSKSWTLENFNGFKNQLEKQLIQFWLPLSPTFSKYLVENQKHKTLKQVFPLANGMIPVINRANCLFWFSKEQRVIYSNRDLLTPFASPQNQPGMQPEPTLNLDLRCQLKNFAFSYSENFSHFLNSSTVVRPTSLPFLQNYAPHFKRKNLNNLTNSFLFFSLAKKENLKNLSTNNVNHSAPITVKVCEIKKGSKLLQPQKTVFTVYRRGRSNKAIEKLEKICLKLQQVFPPLLCVEGAKYEPRGEKQLQQLASAQNQSVFKLVNTFSFNGNLPEKQKAVQQEFNTVADTHSKLLFSLSNYQILRNYKNRTSDLITNFTKPNLLNYSPIFHSFLKSAFFLNTGLLKKKLLFEKVGILTVHSNSGSLSPCFILFRNNFFKTRLSLRAPFSFFKRKEEKKYSNSLILVKKKQTGFLLKGLNTFHNSFSVDPTPASYKREPLIVGLTFFDFCLQRKSTGCWGPINELLMSRGFSKPAGVSFGRFGFDSQNPFLTTWIQTKTEYQDILETLKFQIEILNIQDEFFLGEKFLNCFDKVTFHSTLQSPYLSLIVPENFNYYKQLLSSPINCLIRKKILKNLVKIKRAKFFGEKQIHRSYTIKTFPFCNIDSNERRNEKTPWLEKKVNSLFSGFKPDLSYAEMIVENKKLNFLFFDRLVKTLHGQYFSILSFFPPQLLLESPPSAFVRFSPNFFASKKANFFSKLFTFPLRGKAKAIGKKLGRPVGKSKKGRGAKRTVCFKGPPMVQGSLLQKKRNLLENNFTFLSFLITSPFFCLCGLQLNRKQYLQKTNDQNGENLVWLLKSLSNLSRQDKFTTKKTILRWNTLFTEDRKFLSMRKKKVDASGILAGTEPPTGVLESRPGKVSYHNSQSKKKDLTFVQSKPLRVKKTFRRFSKCFLNLDKVLIIQKNLKNFKLQKELNSKNITESNFLLTICPGWVFTNVSSNRAFAKLNSIQLPGNFIINDIAFGNYVTFTRVLPIRFQNSFYQLETRVNFWLKTLKTFDFDKTCWLVFSPQTEKIFLSVSLLQKENLAPKSNRWERSKETNKILNKSCFSHVVLSCQTVIPLLPKSEGVPNTERAHRALSVFGEKVSGKRFWTKFGSYVPDKQIFSLFLTKSNSVSSLKTKSLAFTFEEEFIMASELNKFSLFFQIIQTNLIYLNCDGTEKKGFFTKFAQNSNNKDHTFFKSFPKLKAKALLSDRGTGKRFFILHPSSVLKSRLENALKKLSCSKFHFLTQQQNTILSTFFKGIDHPVHKKNKSLLPSYNSIAFFDKTSLVSSSSKTISLFKKVLILKKFFLFFFTSFIVFSGKLKLNSINNKTLCFSDYPFKNKSSKNLSFSFSKGGGLPTIFSQRTVDLEKRFFLGKPVKKTLPVGLLKLQMQTYEKNSFSPYFSPFSLGEKARLKSIDPANNLFHRPCKVKASSFSRRKKITLSPWTYGATQGLLWPLPCTEGARGKADKSFTRTLEHGGEALAQKSLFPLGKKLNPLGGGLPKVIQLFPVGALELHLRCKGKGKKFFCLFATKFWVQRQLFVTLLKNFVIQIEKQKMSFPTGQATSNEQKSTFLPQSGFILVPVGAGVEMKTMGARSQNSVSPENAGVSPSYSQKTNSDFCKSQRSECKLKIFSDLVYQSKYQRTSAKTTSEIYKNNKQVINNYCRLGNFQTLKFPCFFDDAVELSYFFFKDLTNSFKIHYVLLQKEEKTNDRLPLLKTLDFQFNKNTRFKPKLLLLGKTTEPVGFHFRKTFKGQPYKAKVTNFSTKSLTQGVLSFENIKAFSFVSTVNKTLFLTQKATQYAIGNSKNYKKKMYQLLDTSNMFLKQNRLLEGSKNVGPENHFSPLVKNCKSEVFSENFLQRDRTTSIANTILFAKNSRLTKLFRLTNSVRQEDFSSLNPSFLQKKQTVSKFLEYKIQPLLQLNWTFFHSSLSKKKQQQKLRFNLKEKETAFPYGPNRYQKTKKWIQYYRTGRGQNPKIRDLEPKEIRIDFFDNGKRKFYPNNFKNLELVFKNVDLPKKPIVEKTLKVLNFSKNSQAGPHIQGVSTNFSKKKFTNHSFGNSIIRPMLQSPRSAFISSRASSVAKQLSPQVKAFAFKGPRCKGKSFTIGEKVVNHTKAINLFQFHFTIPEPVENPFSFLFLYNVNPVNKELFQQGFRKTSQKLLKTLNFQPVLALLPFTQRLGDPCSSESTFTLHPRPFKARARTYGASCFATKGESLCLQKPTVQGALELTKALGEFSPNETGGVSPSRASSYPVRGPRFFLKPKNLGLIDQPFNQGVRGFSSLQGEVFFATDTLGLKLGELSVLKKATPELRLLTDVDLLSFEIQQPKAQKPPFLNQELKQAKQKKPAKEKLQVSVGEFVRYGKEIVSNVGLNQSGQILIVQSNKIVLRYAKPFLLSSGGICNLVQGDFITYQAPLLTLKYKTLKTEDIVQGIPKIEQLFEARQNLEKESGIPQLLKNKFLLYKDLYPKQEAVQKSIAFIQHYIIDGIQTVYQSQGVTISDKHIEIIVKQMTCKVKILDPGGSGLLRGDIVYLNVIELANSQIQRNNISCEGFRIDKKAEYEPIVLGITKAALTIRGFISAASFQETIKILTKAAIFRRRDYLRGLKENVILGHLIPSGTGADTFITKGV